MIKISVIIPVYNAGKYLRQCLDSVLNQSLKEIEVICVDDGSTDDSLNILQEYAGKDDRVKVIHQQNKHAGVARNAGIDMAIGEYLHFLDADDYVLDYAYEVLYNKASVHKLDCLKFRSVAITTEGNDTVNYGEYMLINENPLDFDRLLPKGENSPRYRLPVVPWNGLYLRSFIQKNKIRFNSLICDNDKSFFFRVVTNADRIMISRDRLVVHRIFNNTSLVGTRADNYDCDLQSTKIVSDQLLEDKISPGVSRVIMEREFRNCLAWAGKLSSDFGTTEKFWNDLHKFIKIYDGLYPELLKKLYKENVNTRVYSESQQPPHLKIFHEKSLYPLVSVIIPVYNAQDNLYQCLDSLSYQTLENIEIICVDDGSTDNSGLILREYSFVDKRIQIVEQDHSNAGVARNHGLEVARGKYVIFLDADDFFNADLLERTYDQAKNAGNADVVLFGGKKYDTRNNKYLQAAYYLKREYLPEKETFSRKDLPDRFLTITTPAPWTKLFRREFILKEGLRFQSLPNSNDVYFVLTALAVAEKITCVKDDLVYYRVGESKNIQNQKDKDPTCFLDAYEAVYRELNKRNIYNEVEKSFTAVVLSGCVYNLDTVEGSDNRIRIYRRLLEPSFTEMGLLSHETEYYGNKNDAIKVHAAKQIIEWNDKLTKKEDPCFHTLVDHQKKSPVPKVSVIIPVYNAGQYLGECMDSIIRQSLEDIEVICIDDGSTDLSQNILLEYAESDRRISVYSQKNSGQSAARNRGAELARGKYLYFMDSDDILEDTALDYLYRKAEEDSLDLICFNAQTFEDSEGLGEDSKEYDYDRTFEYLDQDRVYSGKEAFADMMEAGEYKASVPLQFFNRNFYTTHKLCFYEGIIHEDELFTFQCLLDAGRVKCLPISFYHRRLRENSTVTGEITFSNVYGDFICYLEMLKYCEGKVFKDFCKTMVDLRIKNMLKTTRWKYLKLSLEEKQTVAALPSMQQGIFNALITDWCDENNKNTAVNNEYQKNRSQRELIKKNREELNRINEQIEERIKELAGVSEGSSGIKAPLQFNTSESRFKFDPLVWEEHMINGKLCFMVRPDMSKPQRYLTVPFFEPLDTEKEYLFMMYFRIKTDAKEIRFHIKKSGNNHHQVICSYQLDEDRDTDEWITVSCRFRPDSDVYNEFAIDANNVCGDDNYIYIDYINILMKNENSEEKGLLKRFRHHSKRM